MIMKLIFAVTLALAAPKSFHQFQVNDITGKKTPLSQYKGQVVLVVNTASQCGFTPQFKGLEETYAKFKDQKFVVLGFPSNDFGGQDPGSNAEIGAFCKKNYGVTFPMFEKSVVKGPEAQPLFKWLTEEANAGMKGPVGWNFEKFLLDRDGNLVKRFDSDVKPESEALQGEIKKLLAAGKK